MCSGTACDLSPPRVVPKKNGKLRLIHQLQRLNDQLHQPAHFKMEDLSVVAPQLQEDDLMMTLDLDQAYHHVEIHPAHRKYLGFEWEGRFYVWNVLPFGLNQESACVHEGPAPSGGLSSPLESA